MLNMKALLNRHSTDRNNVVSRIGEGVNKAAGAAVKCI